nr:DUF2812 domain-containing protein [Thalassobacillus sp. CUG 92003]
MWTWVPFLAIKLYKSNKRLSEGPLQSSRRYPQRASDSTQESFVKWKFGWQYAPDKLEKWLETMEKKGYQLSKVSMMGTRFLFVNGTPMNVCYTVDYQRGQSHGYFDLHHEAGWQLMFANNSSLSKWSIWAKPYEDTRPEFYSDRNHKLRHARRVAMTHGVTFGLLALMYVAMIGLNVTTLYRDGMSRLDWMLFFIYGFVIIEFAIIVSKSVRYYLRVKHTA